jgi:hypothetical protein
MQRTGTVADFWWRLRHRLRHVSQRRWRFRRLEEDFAFGPPTRPPRLTRQEAIRLALTNPPYTARFHAEYGRYQSIRHRRGVVQPDGTLKFHFLPPINAWKVTVTGISLPRPGGRSGSTRRPSPITAMVIIVDDEKGLGESARGE